MVRLDRAADLALLAVPGVTGPAARVAEARADLVVARTRGALPVDRATRLTATYTPLGGAAVRRPVLRLPVTARPGDSGSPVLDADGRIAGILFAADDTHPGLAWAVAAPAVRALLAG